MSCDRKIGPFDCCSVVQGDCRESEALLPRTLAIVSDPPYGVSERCDRKSKGRSNLAECNDFPPIFGDSTPFNPWPWVQFAKCVLFGANHYAPKLPPSPSWIIWDKRCGQGSNDNADCEMAWAKDAGPARVVYHYWNGMLRESERGIPRVHPTQKPVAVMEWIIEKYTTDADTILDPYAGSGTTLVAAKKLGRHFLGFEISPEYCDIARKRIAAVEAQPTLFEPKAEQGELNL